MKLNEQLPLHSPDPGLWQHLSAELDAMDAKAVYQQKLEQLPVHSPDAGLWAIINRRLNRIAYYKTGIRIGLSIAAGLLIFFTVSRFSDFSTHQSLVPSVANQQLKQPIKSDTEDPTQIPVAVAVTSQNTGIAANKQINPVIHSLNHQPEIVTSTVEAMPAGTETIPVPDASSLVNAVISQELSTTENPVVQSVSDQKVTEPITDKSFIATTPQFAESQNQINTPKNEKPKKYFSPKEPVPGGSKNHFAIAMDYLPENINNGTENSVFHNIALTASYNKEKVKFNTSLGMAYNEDQLEFNMNYDINTPVTAELNGKVDTLYYNLSNMSADFQGTEKHKYFTYTLGIGRKLFSFGKFSTWINAGAGFGLKLNNPDLVANAENSLKNNYSAKINSVKNPSRTYNDVNINFITGIDFNYKVLKRLSITFTPTSRWYFKPVLTKNNQPTDELTLGFKTGMKFEF